MVIFINFIIKYKLIFYKINLVPEISPKNLRVKNYINFSTIELTWDSIPEETLRGYFKGYKVKFYLNIIKAIIIIIYLVILLD